MVIGDFNLKCVAVTPNEAYPELIVDPDTMLSFAVALQCFQAISREKSQIRELIGGIERTVECQDLAASCATDPNLAGSLRRGW